MFPWQVFGLRRFIPTRRTSRCLTAPVSSWAFVPAYRCGAAPDSHRIPFFVLLAEKPWSATTIYCDVGKCKSIPCGYLVEPQKEPVQGEKTVRWSIVAVMGDGRSGLGDQTEEVEVLSRS
jgi:hypothetical protein